jgi:hypothetical protein
MLDRVAIDAVLLFHLAFIAFALGGALLVVRWPWLFLVHVPAAIWGAFVEVSGRICPLTFIENRLRSTAGIAGYGESFIEHYLVKVIYPPGLTTGIQYVLSALVVVVNVAIYAWLLHRRYGPHAAPGGRGSRDHLRRSPRAHTVIR